MLEAIHQGRIVRPGAIEKDVAQARLALRVAVILAYAQEIGWRYVPRAEEEARRAFDPDAATPELRARNPSLFFGGPGR